MPCRNQSSRSLAIHALLPHLELRQHGGFPGCRPGRDPQACIKKVLQEVQVNYCLRALGAGQRQAVWPWVRAAAWRTEQGLCDSSTLEYPLRSFGTSGDTGTDSLGVGSGGGFGQGGRTPGSTPGWDQGLLRAGWINFPWRAPLA